MEYLFQLAHTSCEAPQPEVADEVDKNQKKDIGVEVYMYECMMYNV